MASATSSTLPRVSSQPEVSRTSFEQAGPSQPLADRLVSPGDGMATALSQALVLRAPSPNKRPTAAPEAQGMGRDNPIVWFLRNRQGDLFADPVLLPSGQTVERAEVGAAAVTLVPNLLVKRVIEKMRRGDDWTEELICPITYEFMNRPTQLPDGSTYEESGILDWLQNHETSPHTGLSLGAAGARINVVPNLVAQALSASVQGKPVEQMPLVWPRQVILGAPTAAATDAHPAQQGTVGATGPNNSCRNFLPSCGAASGLAGMSIANAHGMSSIPMLAVFVPHLSIIACCLGACLGVAVVECCAGTAQPTQPVAPQGVPAAPGQPPPQPAAEG